MNEVNGIGAISQTSATSGANGAEKGKKTVIIKLQDQKWVDPKINDADYSNMANIKKKYPSPEFTVMQYPDGTFEVNNQDGMQVAAITQKSSKKGTNTTISEYRNSSIVTANYENGNLVKVDKSPFSPY